MKTITLSVPDAVWRDFQSLAGATGRDAPDLIHDALDFYRQTHLARRVSLRDRLPPASVGGPVRPFTEEENILEEMLDDSGN